MDQRVLGVEVIGVLGFVLIHVGPNDKLSSLLLRDLAKRIHGSPLRRRESPAKEPSVIGIFVGVLPELLFEFAKFIS
jgi:hypothetical protein